MADPKTRSSFIPIMLIVVGLMVGVGILVFAPLWTCNICEGTGQVTVRGLDPLTLEYTGYVGAMSCWICTKGRRYSLITLWLKRHRGAVIL